MNEAPTATVILNRRYARAWRRLGHALASSAHVVESSSFRAGRDATREAAEAGATLVVAAGGDGTIQSVAEGLLSAGATKDERPALGIVPLGHGNDLARALAERPVDVLDVGRVVVDGSERVFVNSLGIGLEGRIAASMWRALPGGAGYTLAALGALLLGRRSWVLQGTLDDDAFSREVSVLSVGNSHSTGGGYRLTPEARTDDGRLDYCAAAVFSRLRLLALMKRARRGAHGDEPGVRRGQLRRLALRVSPPVPVHADGELIAEAAGAIEVDLHPAALRVRLPG